LSRLFAPTRMIFAIPADAELPPPLAAKQAGNETLAYVCSGMSCSAPMADLEEISLALKRPVTREPA
jgi:uncharacterized protein YyaL (SSP411 family)